MIGEKDDTGPKNPVRFMSPKFPRRKSIAPSAINMYPNICILNRMMFLKLHQDKKINKGRSFAKYP